MESWRLRGALGLLRLSGLSNGFAGPPGRDGRSSACSNLTESPGIEATVCIGWIQERELRVVFFFLSDSVYASLAIQVIATRRGDVPPSKAVPLRATYPAVFSRIAGPLSQLVTINAGFPAHTSNILGG